ncbi:Maf family protein [Gorillibacterium sp. CAU 1737]|uniref:Maf family protein n=1 Tax=Gorillibacterium sp. CAU 1737 TaxID=3140362 RepID=UPI0032609BE7
MIANRTLYLASSSPRRQELVRMLGIPYEVCVSEADESTEPGLSPASMVASLAMRKALTVVQHRAPGPGVVLGADTLVVIDGQALGKPRDAEDARHMLNRLQGRTHEVYSGVALTDTRVTSQPDDMERRLLAVYANSDSVSDGEPDLTSDGWSGPFSLGEMACYRSQVSESNGDPLILSGYSVSRVTFRPMKESEIEAYVASGEPMDKAGSYAVQGLGSVFIEKIEGDFYGIMGLPLNLLYPMLLPFGICPFPVESRSPQNGSSLSEDGR